jgi:hypothetical protein
MNTSAAEIGCSGAEHPPRGSSIGAATSCDRYTERLEPSTVLEDGKDGFGKDK